MTPHPAKSKAQRRVLDEIGCGNHSPMMAKATRDAMLASGLIQQCGERILVNGSLPIRIREYQMPIPIHMQWCKHWAEQEDTPQ